MRTGTVKWFNETAGFGYIQPDDLSSDVFVYLNDVKRAGLRTLHEGQRVLFEISTKKRQGCAVQLKVA